MRRSRHRRRRRRRFSYRRLGPESRRESHLRPLHPSRDRHSDLLLLLRRRESTRRSTARAIRDLVRLLQRRRRRAHRVRRPGESRLLEWPGTKTRPRLPRRQTIPSRSRCPRRLRMPSAASCHCYCCCYCCYCCWCWARPRPWHWRHERPQPAPEPAAAGAASDLADPDPSVCAAAVGVAQEFVTPRHRRWHPAPCLSRPSWPPCHPTCHGPDLPAMRETRSRPGWAQQQCLLKERRLAAAQRERSAEAASPTRARQSRRGRGRAGPSAAGRDHLQVRSGLQTIAAQKAAVGPQQGWWSRSTQRWAAQWRWGVQV